MQSVATHTHYFPTSWRGKGHTRPVYLEFSRMYQYRVLLVLQEILGCITTPFLLCFALPQRAEQILNFVKSFTVHVEGVGHVCGFALFDFERHGDTRYGAPVDGMADLRSCDGKMEKAYLNFKMNHPSWRHDAGDGLLDNIAGRGSVAAVHRLAAAAAAAGSTRDELDALGCASSTIGATADVAQAASTAVGGMDSNPMAALNIASVGGASTAFMPSSLGASGLMLLARSSFNGPDSSLPRGGASSTHVGAGYHPMVSFAGAGTLGAVSSELQAEALTADLMGLLDQHFVARDGCGPSASIAVDMPTAGMPTAPTQTANGVAPAALPHEQGEDISGEYVEYAPDKAPNGLPPGREAPAAPPPPGGVPPGSLRPVTTVSTDL